MNERVVTGFTILVLWLPLFYGPYNYWLWNRLGFLIHFIAALVCGAFFFYLRENGYGPAEYKVLGILLVPFFFYCFYILADKIIRSKYNRRFIITSKFILDETWPYNWVDRTFTIIMAIIPLVICVLFDKAIYGTGS